MIVHEADIDPTTQRPRPLDINEVEQAITFIKNLAYGIDLAFW
jgi:hypothetical protein